MQTFKEFLRYLIVGGISFVVDFAVLLYLCEVLFPTATALQISLFSGISFSVSFIVNYYLSLKIVYTEHVTENRWKEMILTFSIALIGLILTIILMYLSQQVLNLNYIISKFLVTGLVLIWNFSARKIFVFK